MEKRHLVSLSNRILYLVFGKEFKSRRICVFSYNHLTKIALSSNFLTRVTTLFCYPLIKLPFLLQSFHAIRVVSEFFLESKPLWKLQYFGFGETGSLKILGICTYILDVKIIRWTIIHFSSRIQPFSLSICTTKFKIGIQNDYAMLWSELCIKICALTS